MRVIVTSPILSGSLFKEGDEIEISDELVRVDDEQLEKIAEYYNSETVAKVSPWIPQIPFHEYVRRRLNGEFDEIQVA